MNGENEVEEGNLACTNNTIQLRVQVAKNAVCAFSYSVDGGEYKTIGELFTAREGRWIGAKVGLFCLTQNKKASPGHADYDWFRFK